MTRDNFRALFFFVEKFNFEMLQKFLAVYGAYAFILYKFDYRKSGTCLRKHGQIRQNISGIFRTFEHLLAIQESASEDGEMQNHWSCELIYFLWQDYTLVREPTATKSTHNWAENLREISGTIKCLWLFRSLYVITSINPRHFHIPDQK